MESWRKWEELIPQKVEQEVAKAPKKSLSHLTDHLKRVWANARRLGEKLGADLEVLYAACMLHDLGRHYGLEPHGPKSAERADPILRGICFPAEKIPLILEAVSQHDTGFPSEKRVSLESKILL